MGFRNVLPEWVLNHLEEYLEDGEKGHYWDAEFLGGYKKTPSLLLTTTGRRSGEKRVMPLPYGRDGSNYVVIASRGGSPDHPGWYYNLSATPQVELKVANTQLQARARTATGAERDRLWQMMAEVYPPYPSYQVKCERQIPVVVLEPLGD
jgi:deazaflavin-dependent oxidoreductase (nitroreductase family)